jgi:hypothetical protein
VPLMHQVARPPDALTEKSVGRTLAQVIELHADVSAAGRWTRAIPVERGTDPGNTSCSSEICCALRSVGYNSVETLPSGMVSPSYQEPAGSQSKLELNRWRSTGMLAGSTT